MTRSRGVHVSAVQLNQVKLLPLEQRAFSLKGNSRGQNERKMNIEVFCFSKLSFLKSLSLQFTTDLNFPCCFFWVQDILPLPDSQGKQRNLSEKSLNSLSTLPQDYLAEYFPLPVLTVCPPTHPHLTFTFATSLKLLWLTQLLMP